MSEGGAGAPRLSIVVPVHDEEHELPAVLERMLAAPCPVPREWVFVDDGSTDRSAQILEAAAGARPDEVRVLRRTRNGGKGAALRDGIAAARGDLVLFHDADLEYDPRDVPRLLEPVLAGEADVVYGSRFRRERPQVHRTFHFLVNRALTMLSNLLSGIYLTDMETGLKLFPVDLLRAMQLRSDRFGVEVEITAYVAKVRVHMHEVPVSYHPRTRLAGKEITWRDGVAALWHLVRFNLLTSREQAYTAVPERFRP